MEQLIEYLKVIFLGIVEGITEWLPISSTGHMLLVDEFLQLKANAEFKEFFFIAIQLGAILAVVLLFWGRMIPFQVKKKDEPFWRKDVLLLWVKVVVACIPGAFFTLLFDDLLDSFLKGTEILGGKTSLLVVVIAAALLLYGVAFLFIEKQNQKRTPRITSLEQLGFREAILIGLFQVLSIIPGTSRSGSTILGGLIIGVDRVTAADFTFFLAVPVMAGYSLLKLLKFGFVFTTLELGLLLVGCVAAFATSVVVIRFLLGYLKKRDFALFGWYRILLGGIVLLYFLVF